MERDSPPAARDEPSPGGAPTHRDVVVIGASAGGVQALEQLASGLPPELPASVLVTLHLLAGGTSMLPAILGRAGALPATAPSDGERLERGVIYVAPPDHHMLIEDGFVRLTRGPRENGHRPAIDPLFRSAARERGRRVVGIVLSGVLDDGAAGLRLIHDCGGATIVQQPGDALYSDMPAAALEAVQVDHVVPVTEMAELICRLLEAPVAPVQAAGGSAADDDPSPSPSIAHPALDPHGEPAAVTCPHCGGALWEHSEGSLVRYECRVGHAFSPESLLVEQSRSLEAALWAALQSLEERADLLRRMARRAGSTRSGQRLMRRAEAAERHAAELREAMSRYADEVGTGEPAGTPVEEVG